MQEVLTARVEAPVIKLSSPATREFWELPVLFEDAHLLAINKPARLLTSPDRRDPDRPNLMKLFQRAIAEQKTWARERRLAYLANAHRLDFETTGVLLLAKDKAALVKLANLFGSEKPLTSYVALVRGTPAADRFEVDAAIAPHPTNVGVMRVDPRRGKKSKTQFEVVERFCRHALLQCRPLTGRPHQIRVHLRHAGFPIVGDAVYRGAPLYLSDLKPHYRLKRDQTERPLIATTALHAEQLSLPHPVTREQITIIAPRPKDFNVALKYLRRYAA